MNDQLHIKMKKFDMLLFCSILIITLSNCRAIVGTAMESNLEYLGYGLLLTGIFISYMKLPYSYRKKYINKWILVLLFLFSVGIMTQEVSFRRKAILLFGMIAIIMISTMSERFLQGFESIRIMAYSVLTGCLLSIFLCIICGHSLIMTSSEDTFGIYFAFNGGIRDKNIATMMIVIMISLFFYSKEKSWKAMDEIVVAVCFIVLLLSNSRGAWIEFLVFVLVQNYKLISKIKKSQRIIFLLCFVPMLFILILYIYNNLVLQSETYLYRYRGLINFLNTFRDDRHRMWLGIAEMVYDKSYGYDDAVRSIIGWNGTIEIAWLNILIKNGLFGVVGFMIIFVRSVITALKHTNFEVKTMYLSVIIMLLASSLVAIYIQSVHGLFGIYSYLLMGFFSGVIHSNNDFVKGDNLYSRPYTFFNVDE